MTTDFKETQHARNHRFMGSDPHEIGLGPASLMGLVFGGGRLDDGFGANGGWLYLPQNDGPLLDASETVHVNYSHFEPAAHFQFLAGRLHAVSGLRDSSYVVTAPWGSSPFGGGGGSGGLAPISGPFAGLWTFMVSTNEAGETITFTFPDTGDEDEQYGFDMTGDGGSGHVGYIFHDFGPDDVAGDVTPVTDGGSTDQVRNWVSVQTDDTFALGATIGEEIFDGVGTVTPSIDITLDSDQPTDNQLVLVTASKGPPGFVPTDAGARPQVYITSRLPSGILVPKLRQNGQQRMLPEQTTPSNTVGGSVDGGSP